MNWGVIIAVLIYEILTIVGVGAFFAYKNKKKGAEGTPAIEQVVPSGGF